MSSLATSVVAMREQLSMLPVLVAPAMPTYDFACAIDVISDTTYMSDNDELDMTQLFMKDKDEAMAFLYLKGNNLKANCVRRKLAEICAMLVD
jgi:hypothetical protein